MKMMKKIEIGDEVAVLDDTISGVVVQVQNEQISIKTADDFLMTFFVNELIKINNSNDLHSFFSSQSLSSVLKEKELSKKRNFVKEKKSRKDEFVLEVDLHIEKLVPSKRLNPFSVANQINPSLSCIISNTIPCDNPCAIEMDS